ncbi:hypothetical protein ACWKWU_10210 [Chitinophaga lutea]
MKLTKFLSFLLCGTVLITSCRKNDDDDDDGGPVAPETLSGNISANKRLTADRTWVLSGFVYVTAGATLTIEPGTVIKSSAAGDGKDALIVERGAKIMAEGTASNPIVFTSGKAAGSRQPGDWGGIIILGSAPTNRTSEPSIEGGVGRKYGGTNPDDNSGVIKYVRIEYAGVAFEPNNEINALTLGGVGRGTTIDYVQTYYANDDAFEFFGGTVNAKHLVAIGTIDDDFDFDLGYSGTVQFAVALRDPKFADAVDAANGIECDNDGSGTNAAPITRPVLSNITIIGPNNAANTNATHNAGNRWRRATDFVFVNSIIMGSQKSGFLLESAASANDFLTAGKSLFSNNIVHAVKNPYWTDSSTARALTGNAFPANPLSAQQVTDMITSAAGQFKVKAEANGTITVATADEVGLTAPFNLSAPNFLPQTGSKALQGTFVPQTGIETVNYRGAFGTTNWMAGWTSFDPQSKVY